MKSTSNENLPVVPIGSVEPGECTVVSVNLMSPPELGSFQTKWRLFTSNGSCFGGKYHLNHIDKLEVFFIYLLIFTKFFIPDTMWSIVQVTDSGTLALTQQLSELQTNAIAENPMSKPPLEVSHYYE